MTILNSLAVLVLATTPTTQYSVDATREGLVGKKTATGHVIEANDIFVALPSRSALNRTVEIEYNGKKYRAKVLDVGPHNTHDDYWNHGGVPKAAQGIREPGIKGGPPKNGAGIDISDGLWAKMGLTQKIGMIHVKWRFVDEAK